VSVRAGLAARRVKVAELTSRPEMTRLRVSDLQQSLTPKDRLNTKTARGSLPQVSQRDSEVAIKHADRANRVIGVWPG
jgi:hypothetical protein